MLLKKRKNKIKDHSTWWIQWTLLINSQANPHTKPSILIHMYKYNLTFSFDLSPFSCSPNFVHIYNSMFLLLASMEVTQWNVLCFLSQQIYPLHLEISSAKMGPSRNLISIIFIVSVLFMLASACSNGQRKVCVWALNN